MRVFRLQPVEPVDPEFRALVAACGRPDRHVGLGGQELAAAIVGIVVDDEEMADAHVTVILQEIVEPDTFVPEDREQQDIVARHLFGAQGNRFQLTPLSERPEAPALSLQPQPV